MQVFFQVTFLRDKKTAWNSVSGSSMRAIWTDTAAAGKDENCSLSWLMDCSQRETHKSNSWSGRRWLKVARSWHGKQSPQTEAELPINKSSQDETILIEFSAQRSHPACL